MKFEDLSDAELAAVLLAECTPAIDQAMQRLLVAGVPAPALQSIRGALAASFLERFTDRADELRRH